MKAFLIFIIMPCLVITPIAADLIQTEGPHGGIVKKADNYFIEMKTADKFFYTYLLNDKQKTLDSKDVTCSVRFFLPDSTDLIVQLKPLGENGFIGENIPGYRYCKITFKVNLTITPSAMFENQKLVVKKE